VKGEPTILTRKTQVAVSGGFDPLHIGHVRLFQAAAELGELTVIINSDDWLKRKKGFVVMPWKERAEIIRALRCVSSVSFVIDTDNSVCQALEAIKPDIFANGGDRFEDNVPEKMLCDALGIGMVFNVGGEKIESSSAIIKRINLQQPQTM
jgi:D-beta-D-heptose 7-phosphate kinase/D-beta-D-heptose 1-phosphate adenosyltransferase